MIEKNANAIPLSYTFLKYITNNFSHEREIGRGGFGIVYKGVLRNGNVAVKKLSRTDDISEKQFEDELFCLIRVKHKNIVRFLGYCSNISREVVHHNGRDILADVQQRFLCFEYIPNKSLKHYLEDESYGRELETRYNLIEGICHGLQYLHNEQRINHLDLKPENILLDYGMVPKITDFGLSRRFGEQSRIITKNIYGTLGYLAPEYLNYGKLSFKSDIYSLGIIMGKILRGNNDILDFQNWHKSQVTDSPQVKRCIEIAQLCVNADEHKRPTIDEIIAMLNEIHMSRSNSVPSLEKMEGQKTQPQHVAPIERSSVEHMPGTKAGPEWNRESARASSSQPPPVRANKEAQDATTTQKSWFQRDESGPSHQSFAPRQTERVVAKETAPNCFGEVVDDYKLNELVRYAGKAKTQEDRARQAWCAVNEDDKKGKALRYVDVLKALYGNGQSTLCLVYNATGDTLYHVAHHDWYGYINDSKEGYPAEIGNSQWGVFHHVHRQGEPSGSMGAVVYRGKKKDGQDQDYLLAWSTPWGIWYRNKAYCEIGGVDYFKRRWDEIYVKLENADYSSRTKSGGCEIEALIDKGDSPKFTATLKTEHGP